jgi:hypothetical protein
MKNSGKLIILIILAALGSVSLSACGASEPNPTPTLGVEAIQTSAVGTFVTGLTQTALSLPTNTPTATPPLRQLPPPQAARRSQQQAELSQLLRVTG